jgi:DNA processing protein
MISESQARLLALCAIRVDGKSVDWSLLARCAQRGHLDALWRAEIPEDSPAARRAEPVLAEGLEGDTSELFHRVEEEVAIAEKVGARLITVLDPRYPRNLQPLRGLPPFLFYRGDPSVTSGERVVAVVGTRDASEIGLSRARRVARELGEAGFVIASGLARGIDTAAHETALHFGNRTVAVVGTGISRCYPKENERLAERIARQGVIYSQFWPSRAPARDTFPRRNHVTSGVSLGSVVIEASRTSGAKMQARIAYEQGRQVLLLRSLTEKQEWARRMVEAGRASRVEGTEQMIDALLSPVVDPSPTPSTQLRFDVE